MNAYKKEEFKSATQEQIPNSEETIRKGPWTVEEDTMLMDYVSIHGEGRWNSASTFAGLRRTGKSCRLRWLNYLRPDVRRGNITLQEQLLILELHSRWGNRWSKIAQQLPGRTDNEIKNYWRTRVQKQAKQLKCDVNSKQFRDAMRYVWVPRLIERIQAESSDSSSSSPSTSSSTSSQATITITNNNNNNDNIAFTIPSQVNESGSDLFYPTFLPDTSSNIPLSDDYTYDMQNGSGLTVDSFLDFHEEMRMDVSLWNDENIWFLQQQLL